MIETKCPKCGSEDIYEDGSLWICPSCSHEWTQHAQANDTEPAQDEGAVRDANGTILQDGDTVTVIKQLAIRGTSSAVKSGTKVKNIRLSDGGDGHNISCKIDGIGAMNLKSEFVRKVDKS